MAEIDMPESFSAKLGPLPVWVWGAIVGVGIVAYVWFSGRTDGSTDPSADTSTGTPTATASIDDAIEGAFRPGTANGGPTTDDDVPETIDTNSAWGLRATAYLATLGISPLTAQRAINAYLAGSALTKDQAALVDKAILGIGQPPAAVEVAAAEAATSATFVRYYRESSGQIKGVSASGTETALTDEQYISAGMPTLSSDSYPWKYYTVPNNSTPLSAIAAKYKVSVNRLIVLNRWKSVPTMKKKLKVKVPA